MNVLVGAISLGLCIYLFYALIRPEKFWKLENYSLNYIGAASMADIIFVTLTLIFFGLTAAFLIGLDKIWKVQKWLKT